MTTLATDAWMPLLLSRLPGAVQEHVLAELQQTIIDYCKESASWRKIYRSIPVGIGDRTLALNTLLPSIVSKVIGVLKVYDSVTGNPLTDRSFIPMTDGTVDGWTADSEDPSKIELAAAATQNGTLTAVCVLSPYDIKVMIDQEMPPVLSYHGWEAIFDGALGRLFIEPSKPYTNPVAANYHVKRYRFKTREGQARALAGWTPNGQNWSFPRFGR